MVINKRNVTLQENSSAGIIANKSKEKELFNIKYDKMKWFFAAVVKSLDMKYGISGMKQIFTKIEIWDDAYWEISQEYIKREKGKSVSYRAAFNDAISVSRLLNDINSIFSGYNLAVGSFGFEEVYFETKSQFIKNNPTNAKETPESLITCNITFEINNKE